MIKSMIKFLLAASFLIVFGGKSLSVVADDSQQVLIELDAKWKYYDQEPSPGDGWTSLNFDDSRWASGEGLLGYDTADRRGRWPAPGLQTELQPNQISYAFRTEFDYAGPVDNIRFVLDTVVDDAAVFFLNGKEIARTDGLPEGDVDWGTRATTNLGTPPLTSAAFVLESPPLQAGRNVMAVAVYNRNQGSSDICLGVRATVSPIPYRPKALYLTWQRDPLTTMTIQWHGDVDESGAQLEFRPQGVNRGSSFAVSASEQTDSTGGADSASIESRLVRPQTKPMHATKRTIYTVELDGLNPDHSYQFRLVAPSDQGTSTWYSFRTMPARCNAPDRPVRIVFGGDVRHRQEWMEAANSQAARLEPDAIVWGGDLAYANGSDSNIHLWDQFFDACMNTLITPDNRVIPIIVGIGNHEVRGGYYWGDSRGRENYQDSEEFRNQIAPFFYNMFAFPGHPGYGVLDFGDYLSILILDTDHSGPVEGKQTEWLRQRLEERKQVTHVIPVYHVAAWPSVRDLQGQTPQRIRQHWQPLFDQTQVRVCFEHHDHAYKRSVPILAGMAHPQGITYLGDGAWGVGVRPHHDVSETWYLERAESVHHLLIATFAGEHLDIKVITSNGRLIDHIIPTARFPIESNE